MKASIKILLLSLLIIGLIINQNVNNLEEIAFYSNYLVKEKQDNNALSHMSSSISQNQTQPSIIDNAGKKQEHSVTGTRPALKTLEENNQSNSIKTVYGENDNIINNSLSGNNINITITPSKTQNYQYMNNTLEITAYRSPVNVIFSHDSSKTTTLQDTTAAQAVKLENITTSISAIITTFEIKLGSLTPQIEKIFGEIWSAKLNSDGNIIPDAIIANTSALTDGSANEQNILLVFNSPVFISAQNTYYNSSAKEAFVFFVFYSNDTDSQFSYYRTDTTTSDTDKAPTYTKSSTTNWTEVWNDIWLDYDCGYVFKHDLIDTQVYFNQENKTVSVPNTNKVIDNTTKSYEKYTVSYNASKAWTNTKFNITVYRFSFNLSLGNASYTAKSYSSTVNWNVTSNFNVVFGGEGKRFISLPKNFTIISVYKDGTRLSEGGDFKITHDIWGNKTVLILTGNGNYLISATSINLLWQEEITTFKLDSNKWVATSKFTMGILYPDKKEGDYFKANISTTITSKLQNGRYNATLFDPNGKIPGNQSILPDYVDKYNNTFSREFNGTLSFMTTFDPNQTTGTWTLQFYWYNGTAVGITTVNITVIPFISMQIQPEEGTNYLENDIVDVIIATLDQSHDSDWPGDNPGILSWKYENKNLTRDGKYNSTHYKYVSTINTSINAFPIIPGRYNISIKFTDGVFNYTWTTYFNLYYRASSTITGDIEMYYGEESITLIVSPLNDTGGKILNASSLTFDVLEAPFNATYTPSTGKYNLTIWNNGFQTGTKTFTIRWRLDGYRNTPNSPWIEKTFDVLVKPRPVSLSFSNNQLNNSDVIYQEKYYTKIIIKDGLNNSYLTIGNLQYTANVTDNLSIQQSNENNGTYQETISILKPNRTTAKIEWIFSETGYETTRISIILHIAPRPLEFLVLTPSSVNASGRSDPISVLINDGVNGSVIDIENEINEGRLKILTDSAQYNGTGTWESEIYKQWIIVYFILTEADADKNITLILTVQLYGYETTDLVITLHVNPLVPTSVSYQAPEETHYFQETQIVMNYMSNGEPIKNYEVEIKVPQNVIYNLTINQNTGERTIIFRVLDQLPNNSLTIIVTMSKEGYATQNFTISIKVLPAQVDINYETPTNVHVSNESIEIPITLTAYGRNVTGQLTVLSWNSTLQPSVSPTTISNEYTITVYLVNEDAGHKIGILVRVNSTVLYGNTTIVFSVAELEKITITYEITGQIAPGEIFSVVLTASQGTQTTFFLYLNQEKSTIDYTKLTANVTITIHLSNGTVITLFDQEAFNSEGKSVLGPFSIPEDAVDLNLNISVEGLGIQPIQINPDIELQKSESQSNIWSLLTWRNISYALAGLAVVGTVAGIFTYLMKKKEEKRRKRNLALQIIGEVSNARALIIVDRRTGYSIFTFKFQDIAVDPQLIAGILHAYGAFDQEMTGDFAVDVPPGFYRVELGNHNISRIVGDIYDFYLITAGPAESLKEGLIKFADWFKKEFWTEEPAVDLSFYDEREKDILQKIAEHLFAWVTTDLQVVNPENIKKLKGLERKIAEYVEENDNTGFTEIIEEFSEFPVSEVFLATNKLVANNYLTIVPQKTENNGENNEQPISEENQDSDE